MEQCTLLVFELVPEESEFYLIPSDIAEKHKDVLDDMHGKFINCHDPCPSLDFLSEMIFGEDGISGEWRKKYKVNVAKPFPCNVNQVVITGFML